MANNSGTPNPLAVDLVKRADMLFNSQERRTFEPRWEEINNYLSPNQHSEFSTNINMNPGKKRTTVIYTSEPIQALYELSYIVHSILTPPGLKWANLKFVDKKDNENAEAVSWLNAQVEKVHEEISISNFSAQIGTFYRGFFGLGTAAIFVEEKDEKEGKPFGGFNFRNWHLAGYAFSENRFGVVDTVCRKFQLTALEAFDRWKTKLPAKIIEKAQTSPDDKFTFLHCLYMRNKSGVAQLKTGKYAKGKEPVASVYLAYDDKVILENSGYIEFPLSVARAEITENENYGNGPGAIAIPNVKTLNKYVKIDLQAAALAARPPVITDESNIVKDINVQEGSVLVVKDSNRIKEFNTGARFEVNLQRIDGLVQQIRKIFFLDKLVLPPRDTRGEMTAYEVAQLRVDLQRILGPLVDRIHNEELGPNFKRCFNMMKRAGVLDKPPASIRNKAFKIEYVNPISRTQNAEDLTAMAQWLQIASTLAAQGKPEALDYVDTANYMKHSSRVLNVPDIVIASDQKVKEAVEQRQAMMQKQLELENQVKTADVNAKNAKANGGGEQQPGGSGLA